MKTIKNVLLGVLAFAFLLTTNVYAQEETPAEEEFSPVYLTLTTSHRSSDPDVDFSDWKETEQLYFDNVTMKNDLIIGSGVYFHYFTPDDSEVIQVSVYSSWADIEAAAEKTNELILAAWPDEEERTAFFQKQSSYYSGSHSDEIMRSTRFQIPTNSESEESLIYYVKKNQRGSGGGLGFNEYFENVTSKNSYLKGYYTHVHAYGANSNDAMEVFVFDSFGDIEKSFDEDDRLIQEHWSDEDERKEFFEGYSKIFSGHGDYIYTNIPSLAK